MRYFAIVHTKDNYGYVLDYYPEEKRSYQLELGEAIIGDFDIADRANAAVWAYLMRHRN